MKLSKPFVVINNIDLASETNPSRKRCSRTSIVSLKTVLLMQLRYFSTYLDSEKEIVLTTSPLNTSTCWGQAIQIFDKRKFCKKGEPVILRATHDYTSVKIDVPLDMDFDS